MFLIVFWKLCIFHVWVEAEPNVTIIAASIPVLRVLFRNIRSQQETGYPSSGAYIRSDNLSKFQNQGMSVGRSGNVEDHDNRGDGDSDRSMLPQGIVRTTEVMIDYDKLVGYQTTLYKAGKKSSLEVAGTLLHD